MESINTKSFNSSNSSNINSAKNCSENNKEIILVVKRIDSVYILVFISCFFLGVLTQSFLSSINTPSKKEIALSKKLKEKEIEAIELRTTKRVLSSVKTSLLAKVEKKPSAANTFDNKARKQKANAISNTPSAIVVIKKIITKKRVNLRAAPSLESKVLSVIEADTELLLLSPENTPIDSEWLKVTNPVGRICWVKKELVQIV